MNRTPVEWRTLLSMMSAWEAESGRVEIVRRFALGFVLPFLLGAVPSYFFMPRLLGASEQLLLALMAAFIAFGGIVAGFVVTLMLFTGRIDNSGDMNYEAAKGFSVRLKFLLASQAATLFSSLMLCFSSSAWIIVRGMNLGHWIVGFFWVIVFGLMMLCLVRMLALPMQIFEMHESWLDALIDSKEEQVNKKYKQ